MKKITITRVKQVTDIGDENPISTAIECEGEEEMDASDGSHTFSELYEHRYVLFMALCRLYAEHVEPAVFKTTEGKTENVWCSEYHSDGTRYDGWFLLGIHKKSGSQITYHLPMRLWNECTEFAEELERAPDFDGHTATDVLERIKGIHKLTHHQ